MIVSRAEILVLIGKAASITEAEAALLDMIHPWCESELKNYLQHQLEYQQHIEFLPIGQPKQSTHNELTEDFDYAEDKVIPRAARGYGTDKLQLKHLPVVLTGLEVREDVGAWAGQADDAFPSTSILTLGTDYYLDVDATINGVDISNTGILHRYSYWPTEPRSIKVTYYGGLSAVQLAGIAGFLKKAAAETVAMNFWKFKALQKTGGAGGLSSERIGKYGYTVGGGGDIHTSMAVTIPVGVQNSLESLRSYGRLLA